jgi:sporulation protein YlmC with PRC-barrel domain
MAPYELRLESLIGRCVVDVAGDRVGKIEEVRAERQADEWVIVEYLVGAAALAERLSAWSVATKLLELLGARNRHQGYRIPWDKLDLSDPDRPHLTCTIDELKQMSEQLEADRSDL